MASQRLDQIDGLRGFAAIAVVFGHWLEVIMTRPQIAPQIQELIRQVDLACFSLGRFGVVAFFCISGLVIPFSFSGNSPLRGFVVSRFFRLYPAYWASIALAVLTLPAFGVKFSVPQVLANITMVQYALRQSDVLGVYWTLFVELVFYGICFSAQAANVLTSARFNALALTVFTTIALAGGAYRFTHPQSTLSIGIFTYLAAMHLGTLTRLHLIERKPEAARLFTPALLWLVIGVTLANGLAYVHADDKTTGWIASITSYVVALITFFLCVKHNWFNNSLMKWLGGISYSMYLFHPIFLKYGHIFYDSANVLTLLAGTISILLAGTILTSMACQRFIEQTSVSFGKTVRRMIAQKT